MQNFKTLTLSLIIGLTFAGGVTFAAWATNVWHGTTWIQNDEVVSAQKVAENFEYLLHISGDMCTEHNVSAVRYNAGIDGMEYCDGNQWSPAEVPCAVASGSIETFATPGTYTWSKPEGACSSVIVQCWGAGGGGSRNYKGGAGGGGGYQTATIPFSALALQETIVIGAGGIGVGTHGGGGAGGNSTFGSHVVAYGGTGGSTFVNGVGGAPRDGYNYGGGDGEISMNSTYGGGGGSKYGATPGVSVYGGAGGIGSTDSWGGAGGGGGYAAGGNGAPYGTNSGGDGGDGACIITIQ